MEAPTRPRLMAAALATAALAVPVLAPGGALGATGAEGPGPADLARLDTPPEVAFTAPDPAKPYRVYGAYRVRIAATDQEDGPLNGAAVRWRAIVHSPAGDDVLPMREGAEGRLDVPYHGDDAWIELRATAVDSAGSTGHASLWLTPATTPVTISTDPGGGPVSLDGVPRETPYTWASVVNSIHTVTAAQEPAWTGAALVFARWTNEPAFDASQTESIAFATPERALSLTATYGPGPEPVLPVSDGSTGASGTDAPVLPVAEPPRPDVPVLPVAQPPADMTFPDVVPPPFG